MGTLKNKLKQAGLAGDFGKVLGAGVSEELGWPGCSTCSDGCNNSCSTCTGNCHACSNCSGTNSNQ